MTRDQRKMRTAFVMLLPALIFLALLIAFPLGKVVHDAFSHVHLINKSMSGFAGIARTHLTMIENGDKQANFETLWKIANALGMRPSALVAQIEAEIERNS